jgi:hypothetical protein
MSSRLELKGLASTFEEVAALEAEQVELELELATQPDIELGVNANAATKEVPQHNIDEPETLEDILLS